MANGEMWNRDHCEIRDYLQYQLGFECHNEGAPRHLNVYRYRLPDFQGWCPLREPEESWLTVWGDPYGRWWIVEPIVQGGRGLFHLKRKIETIIDPKYAWTFSAFAKDPQRHYYRRGYARMNRMSGAYRGPGPLYWLDVIHELRTHGKLPAKRRERRNSLIEDQKQGNES